MAPKHHPTPLSGGDRKALKKEFDKARAMTGILAAQSAEMRAKAETMLQQADRLLCESWNERMWSNGEPIDPLNWRDDRADLLCSGRAGLATRTKASAGEKRDRPQGRNACYASLEGRASPILMCWARNSRKTRIRIGRSPPCPR
jgi:hypothetical protein